MLDMTSSFGGSLDDMEATIRSAAIGSNTPREFTRHFENEKKYEMPAEAEEAKDAFLEQTGEILKRMNAKHGEIEGMFESTGGNWLFEADKMLQDLEREPVTKYDPSKIQPLHIKDANVLRLQ